MQNMNLQIKPVLQYLVQKNIFSSPPHTFFFRKPLLQSVQNLPLYLPVLLYQIHKSDTKYHTILNFINLFKTAELIMKSLKHVVWNINLFTVADCLAVS